jgi:magnesium-transporting ATPase (P-type)
MIPADGIFITGHNVKCDESSATGESDALKKTGGEQVMRLLEQGHSNISRISIHSSSLALKSWRVLVPISSLPWVSTLALERS